MTADEKVVYQSDIAAREEDGNKRLDIEFGL